MLVLHIFFLFLAGMGLFSVLWAIMGVFLPNCRDGWLLCTKTEFVVIYLWLRGVGLVTCPLILPDVGLTEEQRTLYESKDIRLESPESLILRLRKDIT